MSRTRFEGLEALLDAAALLLYNWRKPNWQGDKSLKCELAAELRSVISKRKLHGYREEVKVNWVTLHQAVIERRRADLSSKRMSPKEPLHDRSRPL